MNQEIERKFLVRDDSYKKVAARSYRIMQGYLSTDPCRTVRVRIKGEKGYLTVKGAPDQSGVVRFEWEKEIPPGEAEILMKLCLPGVIEKIRHEIKVGPHLFEIDEFLGDNTGLVVAELELDDEQDDYPRPEWLGAEVTGDKRYYNSMLSEHPYSSWTR